MAKRTLASLDPARLDGQRALVRVDFNVPIKDGVVTDATRIRAALPTITYLRERGAPVTFIPDPASPDASTTVRRLPRGAVALLENTRFHPGEEGNAPEIAAMYAALGAFYVNDAFGSAHRAHATTEGVARLVKPAVSGFLMEQELKYLGEALSAPRRPFVAILGGAKVSGKVDLIEALLPKVDRILIGGAMACTFFKAMGLETGNSLVEADRVEMAADLLQRAGGKLMLPRGAIIAQELSGSAPTRSVLRDAIPAGWAMYDIDAASVAAFRAEILGAGTVVWNGPMGVFETPPFDQGTRAIAEAMAEATGKG